MIWSALSSKAVVDFLMYSISTGSPTCDCARLTTSSTVGGKGMRWGATCARGAVASDPFDVGVVGPLVSLGGVAGGGFSVLTVTTLVSGGGCEGSRVQPEKPIR